MNKIKQCRHGNMIYNTSDVWIGRSYDHYGEYSEFEINFLLNLVNEGEVYIDVGANIGSMVVPIARKLGPSGLTVAIEPQQFVYHTLCGNVALNNLNNVSCFQRACSDNDRVVWVPSVDYSQEGNYGGVSLDDQDNIRSLGIEGKAYPVAAITIDQLQLARVNLIKIDVEGMELEVLKGAIKTIQRYRPFLYVECDRESKVEELITFIKNLGYDFDIHQPPLYNEGNFFMNHINVLDKPGKRIVSANLFCWDKSKAMKAKQAMDTNPQFFNNLSRSTGCTSTSHKLREKNNDYEKYLSGSGIDIGSGHCPLVYDKAEIANWDLEEGDAVFMAGIDDGKFDFVYSSHCLEHLEDVKVGLENWCRILKSGGYLFVVVPDWTLYEKETWPSQFNDDHKASFSIDVPNTFDHRHYNIADDIQPILAANGVELIEVRLEDEGYDRTLPKELDQTRYRSALAQICLIGRKK